MRRRLLLSLLATMALPPSAHAQGTAPPPDPTIASAVPEVVVAAPRGSTSPVTRSPVAVTVLDRRTIEERGYQTLTEALQVVPGVRVAQTGGVGQQSSAFVRGTASRHALVLLDGVPVNDPSEPNGAFNFGNDLTLLDVERVEVLRGPASSLYGSGAIGGVVNIVTRRAPADRAVAPFGEVAGGSFRTLRAGGGVAGTVRAGAGLGAFDYLGSISSLSTRGTDATAGRFLADTGERDGFRGAAAAARLGWTSEPGTTRVEGTLRWRENAFGLDSVPRDDPNYEADDRRWFGLVRAETRLLGAWTTGLRVARTEDRRRFRDRPDAASRASTDDLFRGERTTLDWGNQVNVPDLGPLTDAVVSFGFQGAQERARQASGSPAFRTRVDADAASRALFAAYQVRLFSRLDLSAGVRNDDSDDFRSAATWRLGAVLDVPEAATRLRAAAGTGFLAPSLFQRFGVIGTFFRGNPDLRPERSTSWEVGSETDLPLGGQRDFATAGVTYFDTRLRDLINFDAAFASLENVDRARIRGAELTLTLRPAPWLSATAAWTITDARDARTDERLARRPEHVVAVNARIAPTDRVVVAPEVLFTGRAREGAFASYRDDGVANPTPRDNRAGTIVNLVGTYRATETVSVFVEGRNLGDSRFEPANGFQTPGRSVLVGTRLGF